MPNANQNCGNCYFMMPQTYIDNFGKTATQSSCRYDSPPAPSIIQPAIAKWPPVDPVEGWCGHWSAGP